MRNRIKNSGIALLLIGIVFVLMGVFLAVHYASYIFLGKTVDLNEVLKNGEELPQGEFVSYTCEYPIGNYCELQTYINGIIPTPSKSQLYAMMDEYDGKGLIYSAKVNNKNKIKEFNRVVNGQTESVTVVGSLDTIVNYDASQYLKNSCSNIEGDVVLTEFVIDSTKTRFSQIALCIFAIALGVFCLVAFIKKKR